MRDSIAHAWLKEAFNLSPGEELLLPCESKKERTLLYRRFLKEQEELSKVDPLGASSILVLTTYRKGQWLLRLLRRRSSLLKGKKVLPSGEEVEISLVDDSDRKRRILLMISDGLSEEEINKLIEPPLTEEERKEYFK